mmetsp:Transcript_41089/g.64998  ORF Transcript_41089/g.64998 Transcript_41089/m.64998 type:complete len:200 (-) Transcript_41089:304-903(-)
MASPLNFTTFNPVSKSKTPATASAVYSPRDRPATAWQRSTFSGFSLRSFSIAARPATNIAGWQAFVRSNSDSGPLRHRSSRLKSSMLAALSSISFTAGMSFTFPIIFTYCEPCPGKSSATGSEPIACAGSTWLSASGFTTFSGSGGKAAGTTFGFTIAFFALPPPPYASSSASKSGIPSLRTSSVIRLPSVEIHAWSLE